MLSVIVNGVTTSLDDGTLCHYIDDDGLGMSPLHRIVNRGPLQHGDSDVDYRLDPRIFRLVFDIEGVDAGDLYDKRTALMELFKPRLVAPIFEWVLPNGDTRRLTAHYIGDMNLANADRLSFSMKVVCTFKANDPTFYDPDGKSCIIGIAAGSDEMLVPTPIPMTVGASTIASKGIAVNGGNVDVYPFIRVTGPINDCVIMNGYTLEKLDFTGYNLAVNHYLDINLQYGYKTVLYDGVTNEIDELTADSDLVNFHLAADPDVVDGRNSIGVTGTSCNQATSVTLAWFDRFIGI